ncbi:inositol monophosphatase family protein [Thiococcus pfennigii]|jgi:myo-inositol-1(or 4)-monophosphatase|uniref:inositol monophosphatase family protein n=1 Tax=Thiococcus pfennigii TaxID=1057 RepID=UPI0019071C15|nr:inositol monophosphatase family protein [Thiococcus pfennigii]MBK1700754.1 inositol monophosphatase [Thiococcus pfennigii]MBK1732362.1 inositol monophosphatase [Thiococcus pfennigii]
MNPMLNIATRAARQAGRVLLRHFDRADQLAVHDKGRNDFVTEVDRAAEAAIVNELRGKYPSHAILAEESGQHGDGETVWIIDPLDGTTNYLHGFPQFAVSIGLKHRGKLELGLVYNPLSEEMFTAVRGQGAHLNDRRLRVGKRPGLDGALIGTGFPFRDQKYMDRYLGMLRAIMQEAAGIRRPGSASLDLAYVAAGRLDGFWELGLAPWDLAGGAVLIAEAGGTVTDLAGGGNFLHTGNLVAGNLKVHQAMLGRIRPFLDETLPA